MLTKEIILQLHLLSIEKYGGSLGIRDEGLLESAVARPFQSFEGQPLYATYIEQAAAIAESIITNHPFVDGNKRTGLLALNAILLFNGAEITANENSLYSFIIDISTGTLRFEQIVDWLKENSSKS